MLPRADDPAVTRPPQRVGGSADHPPSPHNTFCSMKSPNERDEAEAYASKRKYVTKRIEQFETEELVTLAEGVQKKHYRQLIDEPLRKVKEQGHQQVTPLTKQQMVSCLFKIGSSVSGVGCRKQRITGPISIDARA